MKVWSKYLFESDSWFYNNHFIVCWIPLDHMNFQERNFLLEGCNEPCLLYDWFGIIKPIFGDWDFSIRYWNQDTLVQVCLRSAEEVQNEWLQAKQDSFPFRS